MVFRCTFFFLLMLSTAAPGQNTCLSITRSNNYYTASATNVDENEARTSARSLLIEQISTTVSSRIDLSTTETTAAYRTSYSNQTKSVSQLYISGIQYFTCARDKRNGTTVMAYISKQDLEKSKDEVSRETGEYLELMEQKKLIGADYLPDAYIAYLHTFLTPYAIAYSGGSIKTNDVRAYLDSFFMSVLSKIKLTCTGVEENKEFPEQLLLHLKVEGIDPSSMKFVFYSPEFNAECEVVDMSGSLNVLMDPVSSTDIFKGILTLKPLTVSGDLVEVDRAISLSREIEITANMMPAISINFSINGKGESLQLIPIIRHLSVRSFKWISGGNILSTDQRPVLSRKDISNITLMINDNSDLSVTKDLNGTSPKADVATESIEVPAPVSDPVAEKFRSIESFSELQPLLSTYKRDGKASFGRRADFVNPSNCWIFLVDPNTKKIMYLLTPESDAKRTDVKSNSVFTDFEKQIKGLTSIWAEFY